jgi:hypothetical protein
MELIIGVVVVVVVPPPDPDTMEVKEDWVVVVVVVLKLREVLQAQVEEPRWMWAGPVLSIVIVAVEGMVGRIQVGEVGAYKVQVQITQVQVVQE